MIFTIALMILGQAAAPDITASRQLFEAGQYEQIVAIPLDDASPPSLVYLVAQSHDRLKRAPAAREAYGRLTGRPDTDPWHHVGQSALLLLDARPGPAGTPPAATVARAVAAAEHASTLTPSIAEAQYQLGLAEAERRDYGKAAPASKPLSRSTRRRPTPTTSRACPTIRRSGSISWRGISSRF